jgi:hypothetical protein
MQIWAMMGTSGTDEPVGANLAHLRQTERRLDVHLDLISAILLSIATVATAWCVYQATGWNGQQTRLYAEASSRRIESTRDTAGRSSC